MAADSLRAADLQFGRYTTEWDGSSESSRYRPVPALWGYGKNNRPICLHLNLQRKRFIIKRIGRLLSPYLVQSVHAP